MKRALFDSATVLACIFAPWTVAGLLLVLGLCFFDWWWEGALGALLLDIILFGGNIGPHTLYVIAGFCALYYVSIRFKYLLRVA